MTDWTEPPGDAPPPMAWLERANRLSLLARLVATTVHDVNNALQVIGGGVELLQMKPADPDAVTRAIGGQADRANRLLLDLTRFARDTGSEPEPIDLRELAEQALALRHFALTRLRAARAIEGEAVTVAAVRRDVLQILLNLLVNAELALPGVAGPSLRMVIAHDDARATIAVEDNGPGVPPDLQERLFDGGPLPDQAPVDRLGIGLPVSRALAERLGGTLAYAAREPSGAVFTLGLPRSCR